MVHKDTGWRPASAGDAYGDYEIWEYDLGVPEVNAAGEPEPDHDELSDEE